MQMFACRKTAWKNTPRVILSPLLRSSAYSADSATPGQRSGADF